MNPLYQTFKLVSGLICRNADNPADGGCHRYRARVCCAKRAFWTQWGAWSDCDKSCDRGTKTRTRLCDQNGDTVDCQGDSSETEACNIQSCRELFYFFFNLRRIHVQLLMFFI